MKPSLILRVPEPCDEPWFDMEATQKGRTCGRCSKELVDFTGFSNGELVDFLNRQSEEVCGRYSTNQLNKDLLPTAASWSGLTLPTLALLAATMTVNPAQSQTTPHPSTEVSISKDSLNDQQPILKTISGTLKITDIDEGAYGIVELKHKGLVVQRVWTDFDGRFTFSINQDALFDSINVFAHDAAFMDTIVVYTPAMTGTELVIYVQNNPADLMIVGYAVVDKKTARKNRRAYRREHRGS